VSAARRHPAQRIHPPGWLSVRDVQKALALASHHAAWELVVSGGLGEIQKDKGEWTVAETAVRDYVTRQLEATAAKPD
jgi:hypothetical protein